MKRITIGQEVFLKYERENYNWKHVGKKGAENIPYISLYKDNLDHPPSKISTVSLKKLIRSSLNLNSFKSISRKEVEDVVKDLKKIQEELEMYLGDDYPEFGFGDNT
jgi:hypothetical protein